MTLEVVEGAVDMEAVVVVTEAGVAEVGEMAIAVETTGVVVGIVVEGVTGTGETTGAVAGLATETTAGIEIGETTAKCYH